jgi:phospholipid/cholesterol/gamma-HCH transport system substrate-binding protein
MSLSKEARIGILVTISLIVFFIGFYFLKGSALFSSDKKYYCIYTNVEGLQLSANVQVRGLNVGRVSHMELLDNKGVKVTLSIYKSVDIPEGTVATLASPDILSPKIISLDLGPGPGIMHTGSTIRGGIELGIVDNVSAELTPRLKELQGTIIGLDSSLAGINAIVGPQNQQAIAGAIRSIQTTADNLSQLSGALNKEGGEITGVIHNANSITGNLAKNNDAIQRILTNLDKLSGQLANAPIEKSVADLQTTLSEFKGIANKINNNQGSLGMLINDKDFYNNLNSSLQTLNSLMGDIKAHPTRYVNVTIFGKKKQ